MSNKQQTAVMQIINKFDEIKDLDSIVQLMILRGFTESLLELEKQRIVEHHTWLLCGVMGEESARQDGEQYYNETYDKR